MLINCKNKKIKLSQSKKVREHFDNSNSYAFTVLDQINNDKIYDSFFYGMDYGIVLDIGANIGLFSLYAGAKTGLTVYALEPTPSHFELLKILTKPYKNIKCFDFAVSDKTQETTFYLNSKNTTMNSLVNSSGDSIKVNAMTIPDFIDGYDIDYVDLIKIDIEGSEMQALTLDVLSKLRNRVGQWFVEVHETSNAGIEENRQELLKRFGDAGITVKAFSVDQIISA
jgi:FkbM family methyltransferase